jgi:hypothetical protein
MVYCGWGPTGFAHPVTKWGAKQFLQLRVPAITRTHRQLDRCRLSFVWSCRTRLAGGFPAYRRRLRQLRRNETVGA